jgi:hypothetical protein
VSILQSFSMAGFAGNPYLGHCEGKVLVSCTIFFIFFGIIFPNLRFFSNFFTITWCKDQLCYTINGRVSWLHGLPWTCKSKNGGPVMWLHLHPLAFKVF